MIKGFRGKYFFLSNFYDFPVTYKGVTYLNSEAAFQAQKILDNEKREKLFSHLSPSKAKSKGRSVNLRHDWEQIKDKEMYNIVFSKFSQDKVMMERLLNTEDQYLEETNTWNDTYWGVCKGTGKNKLGKILMKVREELRNEKRKKNIFKR